MEVEERMQWRRLVYIEDSSSKFPGLVRLVSMVLLIPVALQQTTWLMIALNTMNNSGRPKQSREAAPKERNSCLSGPQNCLKYKEKSNLFCHVAVEKNELSSEKMLKKID